MGKWLDLEKRTCGDCGVDPGTLHDAGCDVERCPECGGQMIGCGCHPEDTWPADSERMPWTGIWPGEMECIEFGWYSKWAVGPGWVRCEKDSPEATPDLNRLGREGLWDKKLKRWVLPK